MKTMTCKDLGGPCDLAFQGENADVVIKMMDKHVRAVGDTDHAQVLADFKARWKRPWAGMGWYKATKATFAALPED